MERSRKRATIYGPYDYARLVRELKDQPDLVVSASGMVWRGAFAQPRSWRRAICEGVVNIYGQASIASAVAWAHCWAAYLHPVSDADLDKWIRTRFAAGLGPVAAGAEDIFVAAHPTLTRGLLFSPEAIPTQPRTEFLCLIRNASFSVE